MDESTQAEWLEQAFSYMRNWDYVPMAAAFNLEDTSTDTGDRVDNYGLMHHDGTPKPAFAASAPAHGCSTPTSRSRRS